jgi:outer membrane biosynthesis protein TonB
MSLGADMLLGCAAPPPPAAAKTATLPPPPPPAPVMRQPRPIPLPEHKPVPPPEPGGPAPEGEAIAMPAPQPSQSNAMAAYPAQPHELIGLDQRAATRLFGTAAERSEAPPATVWRWRSATCELDLYFYLDLRSGQMRSLHYAFKGDAAGLEDCLKSLAVAARS